MGIVNGKGEAPRTAPGACVECGKPFSSHKGIQTHLYRRTDGFRASLEVPPVERRPTVDEMATEFLRQETAIESLRGSLEPRRPRRRTTMNRPGVDPLASRRLATEMLKMGHSVNQVAIALGQQVAMGLRDPIPTERPRDPNVEGRTYRHRRFPCRWWRRRCRCAECNRKPDYAHIEALERECRIRNEEGELVWPDPKVGDQDRHGRTVVCVGPEGEITWDRAALPEPPSRYQGERSWV